MKYKKENIKSILTLLLVVCLSYISFTNFLSWKATAVEEDTTPPELISFSIEPQTINTEDADAEITITAEVYDNSGQIDHLFLTMEPESGAEHMHFFQGGFEYLEENTYVGVFTFPQYIAKGNWHVEVFELSDRSWNSTVLSKTDIEAIAGVGSATINNAATIEDVDAPQVVSFEILDKEINTENDEDIARLRATVTDDRTGVEQVEITATSSEDPDSPHRLTCNMEPLEEEGDEYECDITFPWGVVKGWWELEIRTQDSLGNYKYYNQAEIVREFGDAESKIFNAATKDDLIPPELVSFSITPNVFDTTKGEVELTMEVRIKDNMTGVVMENMHANMRTAAWGGHAVFENFVRTQGNDLDGTYRSTITLPVDTTVGIWAVEGVTAEDRTGNYGCTVGEGVDTNDFIVINSANSNEVKIDGEDWIISSEKVVIVFPDQTVITKKDGGDFAFYRMLSQFYDVKELGGLSETMDTINNKQAQTEIKTESVLNTFFACNDGEDCVDTQLSDEGFQGDPVALLRAGIPGISMSFSQPVEIEIKEMFDYEGQELIIQTFHEGGDEWVEETTCLVEEVEYFRFGEKGGGLLPDGTWLDPENPPKAVSCIFTVDHASFFGVSVLGESTTTEEKLPETGAAIVSVVSFALVCVLTYILVKRYMSKKEKDAGKNKRTS